MKTTQYCYYWILKFWNLWENGDNCIWQFIFFLQFKRYISRILASCSHLDIIRQKFLEKLPGNRRRWKYFLHNVVLGSGLFEGHSRLGYRSSWSHRWETGMRVWGRRRRGVLFNWIFWPWGIGNMLRGELLGSLILRRIWLLFRGLSGHLRWGMLSRTSEMLPLEIGDSRCLGRSEEKFLFLFRWDWALEMYICFYSAKRSQKSKAVR